MPRMATALVVATAAVGALAHNDTRAEFEAFKAKFGKAYPTAQEEESRFAVFQHNMKKASMMQGKFGSATFGANVFADQSEAEFKVYHNLKSEQMDKVKSGLLPTRPTHPKATSTKVDWRSKGAVTPIKNQGQCGSCWSFSTTGSSEGQWFLAGNKLESMSEQQFVSCDTVDFGCQGGWPYKAMGWDIANEKGQIVMEADYPYVSGTGNVPACRLDLKKMKVAGSIDGHEYVANDEKKMAEWTQEHGPLSILVNAGPFQTYTSGILANCPATQIDHAVLIVGYDMTNSPPYWIVKNSWGVQWGEDGYIRVEFGKNECNINFQPASAIVKKKDSLLSQ